MMLTRSLLNKALYGPSRTTANTEIKDVLSRDHVLQKGEWNENVQSSPWTTSFAISFKNPGRKDVQRVRDVNYKKNVSGIVLGSAEGRSLATTAEDFDNKLEGVPEKIVPSLSTNIADFSPKYMSDKSFGKSKSLYATSFSKKNQALQGANARNRAECQEHTNDLNTTHFQLGTHGNVCDSEMTSSFQNKSSYNSQEKYATTRLHSIGAVETCKSSVFRSGDWNEAESRPQPCSVTCQDFHIKPFSVDASDCNTNTEVNSKKLNTETGCLVDSTDGSNQPYYQRRTHFVLGNDREERNSLYHKDFMLGNCKYLSKPLLAPPPISSKVFPGTEEGLYEPSHSPKKADFENLETHIQQIGQGRGAQTKLNWERHNAVAVVLSCDAKRHTRDRQSSMTGADYRVPTSELKCLSPRKAPRSRYRYLDSDGALLTLPVWPIPPETKEKFNTTQNETAAEVSMKYKSKRDDCRERIHDNRRSHFQFGSNVDFKHSEQRDQFSSSNHVDQSLPAAGKSEGPEGKYSHVYQRSDNQQDPMNINLRKALLEFDTSLSGRISKDDLCKVMISLSITMNRETFEKLCEMCDSNHSGLIDYLEFSKHLSKDELTISRGAKSPSSSVMKTDFCPPEQRKWTSAQQRAIEMSERIATLRVSSHYFHKHNTGAPRLSTTAQDFVRPDRMLGSQHIQSK